MQISLTNATQWTFCDVGQTIVAFFLFLDSTTLRPPVSSCEEVTTANLDHCTAVCVSLVNSSTDIIETCVSGCFGLH